MLNKNHVPERVKVAGASTLWVSRKGFLYLDPTTPINVVPVEFDSHQYKIVRFKSTDNKIHRKTLHSIVAEAFLGPRPRGKVVNHIDGNKWNNEAKNLEYLTREENLKHARELGIDRSFTFEIRTISSKEGPKKKKIFPITTKTVKQIKQALVEGLDLNHIARTFHVSRYVIDKIQNGEAYKNIKGYRARCVRLVSLGRCYGETVSRPTFLKAVEELRRKLGVPRA